MTELADELLLMTNLYPVSTGLPMVIWVGPSYDGAQHDVRIKAMMYPRPADQPGRAGARPCAGDDKGGSDLALHLKTSSGRRRRRCARARISGRVAAFVDGRVGTKAGRNP